MVAPERLWTPWRMKYLTGATRENGCVFCNRLRDDNDVESLILHRTAHCFVIMNLYPYGSGHVLILPNEHIADPADLDQETRHEMADLLPFLTTLLRRTLFCDGFNSGFNLGAAGGAGIAEHLHQHVVPRWIGDANFMPIIASTKALPETLPIGYAKIRLEIARTLDPITACPIVALTENDEKLVLVDGKLPTVQPEDGRPLWHTGVMAVPEMLDQIEVAGWAGSNRAGPGSEPGLVLRGVARNRGQAMVTVADALHIVSEKDRVSIERGLRQLAPMH